VYGKIELQAMMQYQPDSRTTIAMISPGRFEDDPIGLLVSFPVPATTLNTLQNR
jgi:hypothetical protein